MITLNYKGWKISRRLGVGQRERVRSQLLQILCIRDENIEEQIIGALNAAVKLQMQLRIYVNCERIDKDILHKIIHWTFNNYRNHDFMEETQITSKRFEWILNRSDIVIEEVGNNIEDLKTAIVTLWNDTDGRKLNGKKTYNMSINELQNNYPEYFGSETELWISYTTQS